ncbi:MAG: tetratricopeptide repeat protein [Phycisphaeraceae bacterium]
MNPHFLNGERLLGQGRAREAADAFRQSLSQDPQNARSQGMLALALYRTQERDEALRAAHEAVRLDAEDPFSFYVLGLMCMVHGQLDEATRAANESIRLAPTDAEYYRLLALIRSEQKQHKEALRIVELGLEQDPSDSDCLNLRSQLLVKLGRKDEAKQTSEQALANAPDDADSHANAGWTALHHNEAKRALDHFKEALRLEPGHDWAKAGLAEALKARNPLYRVLLGFMLWMVRLDSRVRLGVIIGGYVMYRVADSYAESNPALAPFIWPLLIAYITFAWMTWVGMPLADLVLRLSPYGRHALSPRQNLVSFVLAGFILTALTSFGLYLIAGQGLVGETLATYAGSFRGAAIQLAVLALITIGVLQVQHAPRYKLLLAGCGTLGLLMVGNWLGVVLQNPGLTQNTDMLFFYGFIGMMWFIALGGAGTPRTQFR